MKNSRSTHNSKKERLEVSFNHLSVSPVSTVVCCGGCCDCWKKKLEQIQNKNNILVVKFLLN